MSDRVPIPETKEQAAISLRRTEYDPVSSALKAFEGDDVRQARRCLQRVLFGEQNMRPLDVLKNLRVRPDGSPVTDDMLRTKFEEGLSRVAVTRLPEDTDEAFDAAVREKREEVKASFERLLAVLQKVPPSEILQFCSTERGRDPYFAAALGRARLELVGRSYKTLQDLAGVIAGVNHTVFGQEGFDTYRDIGKDGITGQEVLRTPNTAGKGSIVVLLVQDEKGYHMEYGIDPR